MIVDSQHMHTIQHNTNKQTNYVKFDGFGFFAAKGERREHGWKVRLVLHVLCHGHPIGDVAGLDKVVASVPPSS